MSDLFKGLCQDTTNEKFFGICDDRPHQRADLDTSGNNAKWLAIVQNKLQREITFTALDNCIEIKEGDGRMSSRCEGIITYDDTVIFIEAKQRLGDARTWARDADRQLRNSIERVGQIIDMDFFQTKKAAISNRLQGKFNEKHSVRIKKFMEDTGYILSVEKRIVIE